MGRAVLISIHSEHVANILNGRKVFEYRKIIPQHEVSHLVFYCTAPVMKIVAVAEVVGCVVGSPTRVWNVTSFGAGISRRFFREYFSGQQSACAFSLGKVYEIGEPLDLLSLTGIKSPPQSFCYLDDNDMEIVLEKRLPMPSVASHMVFVGGIHGVGKSTICREVFQPAGYQCVTASSLIAEHGKETDHNKRVDRVKDNQAVLLQALGNAKSKHDRLLLDGHFSLVNGRDEIEPIDVEVFRAMKLDQLILIKGRPEEIAIRLKARDGKVWQKSFLSKFQEEEETHARYVAKTIGVPLRIIRSDVFKERFYSARNIGENNNLGQMTP
jgi:adenylate kinase